MTHPHIGIVVSRRRRFLYLVLMLELLLPARGHAAGLTIDTLLRNLAQVRSDHAYFTETKSIAMLDAPVQSSGELFYTAPDHLEKRTLQPKPESLILDHDSLVIERGRHKHQLRLQDYPELAAFIDSIRSTLAGDRSALERNYQLSLEGTAEHWTLQLLPINKKIQAVVTRIRIAGVRDAVRSIDITQADGDSSLMLIDKSAAP